MLKIAFLVTFCGLLARMAQAQTALPCNHYPVYLSCDTLNEPVAQAVPSYLITPAPKLPITDSATGAEYTNLTPTQTPTTSCNVGTKDGGYLDVTVGGATGYKGDITGPQPTKGVSCDVSNEVKVPYTVTKSPEGDIKCKAPPSTDQAEVTCSAKPATSGLLGGLLQILLNLLKSLLGSLTNEVEGMLKSVLPSLLSTVEGVLNGVLKTVTDSKPVGDKGSCNHKVEDLKTDSNGYMNMVVESTKYLPDGTPKTPPAGTYIPPVIQPPLDSACIYAVPQQLINKALEDYTKKPFEVTGSALDTLSKEITSICGNPTTLGKLTFAPTGTPQVAITGDKVSGTLTGNLEVYDSTNASPFLTASGTLQFSGQFTYAAPSLWIHLVYDGIVELKFVTGRTSCDVSYQAAQTFTAELKGKATIEERVEASPVAYLPIKGPTKITPSNGCVVVDHKKY